MARRWPPPHYETELEVGLPHERQFTIACIVAKYRETGKWSELYIGGIFQLHILLLKSNWS